ncbi:MAG: UPF0721 transmembrane protein [Thermomicrobiales bacterium]|nr:MAG: UPF0721 transmembrane protein [Thermomicrobiales bacterium]
MDVTQAVELGIVAAGAAIVGSMLGLGGGVFLVPIFTLFFGVDQKLAIGASAVAVVTNSVVGSSVHSPQRLHEPAPGDAPAGHHGVRERSLAPSRPSSRPSEIINAIFGAVLLYAAVSMALRRQAVPANGNAPGSLAPGRSLSTILPRRAVPCAMCPSASSIGLGISGVAGVISGMLGVGGGVIQVPAMNLLMRVPVKAAAGTSAFMVGITSVATAFVFYAEEKMDPRVVVPAIIGIFAGSQARDPASPGTSEPSDWCLSVRSRACCTSAAPCS